MFKIALDAGHFLGTPGRRIPKYLDENETKEWQLNSRVCENIEEYMKAYDGYELLRVDDVDGKENISLDDRVSASNSWGADFYLSIHHNAGIDGGAGGGITAFSYYGSEESALWRNELYYKLIEYTGLSGNRANPLSEAGFYVLRHTDCPAVLLELGFMDSTTDAPIILTDEFSENCARAIVEVIAKRADLKKREEENHMRYNTLEEIPDWAKATVEKLLEKGYLYGGDDGLGLTEDMLRLLVINDRAGLY